LKFNGKDTIANHLCSKYGYRRVAFADPIKEICAILFGFSHEQLHGSLKEVPDPNWFGVTPRRVLQFVGTDMFRAHMKTLNEGFKDEFWLLCAERAITKILKADPNAKIVISDVRFENECEMIRRLGGVIIRVSRPDINKLTDLHESERLIPSLEVNFEVKNDSSIDVLQGRIDDLFGETQENMEVC